MQNPNSVITRAVEGYGLQLAELYDVSPARFYQILEADNYGKTRRLIRLLGSLDKERVRWIRADLMTLFDSVLGTPTDIRETDVVREMNDVTLSFVRQDSTAKQLIECREANAALSTKIAFLEQTLREMHEDLAA